MSDLGVRFCVVWKVYQTKACQIPKDRFPIFLDFRTPGSEIQGNFFVPKKGKMF